MEIVSANKGTTPTEIEWAFFIVKPTNSVNNGIIIMLPPKPEKAVNEPVIIPTRKKGNFLPKKCENTEGVKFLKPIQYPKIIPKNTPNARG